MISFGGVVMKKILIVVDMQNDFIDGPLGTPEARAIVDNVCAKIREGEWDCIFTTQDTHDENYLETQEGKKLPVIHCNDCGDGWFLNDKIHAALHEYDTQFYDEGYSRWCATQKNTFGCLDLIYFMNRDVLYNDRAGHNRSCDVELTLVGVCTDICVISNALLLKAHYPEMKIVVDASCCAGSSPEKHRMALEVMKSCQIDILNECKSVNCQVDIVNES